LYFAFDSYLIILSREQM